MVETPSPDASGAALKRLRSRRRAKAGPEARQRRRRLWSYALMAASGLVLVNALVGDKGYLATLRARHAHETLVADIARLRIENADLREHARRLKEDPSALEEAARRDLGLVRPGEVLIIVKDREPAGTGSQ